MARRADHTKQEMHDMVVATARGIISDQGIGALSTRAIAKEIGYTPGTLYQHFKDLNEIILHVNACTMQELVDHMSKASAGVTGGPGEMIHKYADIYLNFVRKNKNNWDAMFQYRGVPDYPAPQWYLDHIAELVRLVEACFAALPAQGAMPPDLAAKMVWASVHSVCSMDRARLEMIMSRKLERVVHDLVDIHIKAYGVPELDPAANPRRPKRAHT